jgi:hypothetical protein
MSIGTEGAADIGNSGLLSSWAFAASNTFGVTTNGILYASKANIRGSINATELIIGQNENEDETYWLWNEDGLQFKNGNISSIAITNDGQINADAITTGTLSGDLIKGGTLVLGNRNNDNGVLKIYNSEGSQVGQIDNNGFILYGQDGGRILMSYTEGFAGYNSSNQKVYYSHFDDFSMKKSKVEEEIILNNKVRFVPIQITNGNVITNDGIGIVGVGGNN